MIFRRQRDDEDIDDEDDEEEEEIDYVLFQGALNGNEVDLAANARLAQAGLIPTKELITDAIMRRAERVLLDPKGQRTRVMLMVDGVAYPSEPLRKQEGLAVTQMIKLLCGLDPKERSKPQAGGVKAEHEEIPYQLNVASEPIGQGAERLMVTVKNLKQIIETPNDLNFPQEMREKIREQAAKSQGLILGCGPSYSGLTTMTQAVMRCVDVYLYSCYSLADLGGKELPNVTPFVVKDGDDFAASVLRMTRNEGNVLYLDPIDSAERAKEIFPQLDKMAMMAESPGKDAVHGLLQLAEWVGSLEEVVDKLSLVFSCKLIRTLCDECKEAYPPNPRLLQKIGLPPETKLLYRKRVPPDPEELEEGELEEEELEPCFKCGDLGYYGRAGMFEMIEMTAEFKEFLGTNPPYAAIKNQIRKLGMQTFQKEGLRLVAEGKTSLEELQRVFKGK